MRRYSWVLALIVGCQSQPTEVGPPQFPTTREPCAAFDPQRRALFGDLHVHTGFSFDARSYDTVLHPRDAYRFARGEPVGLAPLDADGNPTRRAQLDRPLDFVAVTDHAEFLGEILSCTVPGSPGYDAPICAIYRDPAENGATELAIKLSVPGSPRFSDICGPNDSICIDGAIARWREMQFAAEEAYDRTSACSFTSFVGYEYTNTAGVSNLHRNVVFANSIVPERPISMFEAPTPLDLWTELAAQCRDAGTGCDVVVLPHNSNLSNGNLFYLPTDDGLTDAERRDRDQLRVAMEPVVEMFQHKGDSECRNGVADDHGDPLCDFEKLRPADAEVCPADAPGSGGMRLQGCVHRLDFVRNVLRDGLARERAVGVNPYRLGFIGSTDTHNGTPGNVATVDFPGHVGVVDDTVDKRLGAGTVTHDGVINNPGGLAAVWATENSRPAIIDALRRRETFATSGPRIEVRFFAGGDFDASTCDASYRDLVEHGYQTGVPMGGTLTASSSSPSFLIHARADRQPLERLQIVKGWIDAQGATHERVFDVDVIPGQATVNSETCETVGTGWDQRCAVWTDPSFDGEQNAFYYARVVETPSCRWSTLQCNQLSVASRPAGCDDPEVEQVVQQRAWSSPIWLTN